MTGMTDEDPGQVDRPGVLLGRPGYAYEIAELMEVIVPAASTPATGGCPQRQGGASLRQPEGQPRSSRSLCFLPWRHDLFAHEPRGRLVLTAWAAPQLGAVFVAGAMLTEE